MISKNRFINEINESFSALIFTYKNVGMDTLHYYYLDESELRRIQDVIRSGVFLLQTCNRVELYIHGDKARDKAKILLKYIEDLHHGKLKLNDTVIREGIEAIKHLFYVASGVDSIAVGEYEILNQIKCAIASAKKIGTTDRYLEKLVDRSLKVGRVARTKTNISKGKVGIYSLALEKIKEVVENINSVEILILGAGEIGSKMSELLYKEGVKNVTIMNRTESKAVDLAQKYGYKGIKLDLSKIKDYDVAISAISGIREKIELTDNKPKVVVDLSVPPLFAGINVLTLSDLQDFSTMNMANRLEELPKIDKIVDEGVNEFIEDYMKEIQNEIISKMLNNVEKIREEEVNKAKKELMKRGIELNTDIEEILDIMSKSIINKGLEPVISGTKKMIENDERNYINFLITLFNYGHISDIKTKEIKKQETTEGSGS